MQLAGRLVHHAFDMRKRLAAAALDHVRGDGPGAAREADQGNPPGEFAAYQAHGVHDISQLAVRIRNAEPVDVGGAANRPGEHGSLTGGELQAQIHGMWNGQDVRKQNGGIERIAVDRLQGHLAGDLLVGAHGQKIACARPGRTVFRQVSAGLAHEPDRPPRRRLAQQCAQQQIVLERAAHVLSDGSNSRACYRMA